LSTRSLTLAFQILTVCKLYAAAKLGVALAQNSAINKEIQMRGDASRIMAPAVYRNAREAT
jgi:hypothetical protein